jgi:hypothetical protein
MILNDPLTLTKPLTLAGGLVGAKVFLTLDVASLSGTGVYRLPSPATGTVTKLWSITKGALTTGDATLTLVIGNDSTNGVVTITQAGSAAGDIDSAVPTDFNTVAAGDKLSMQVGGSNGAAVGATVIIEITTTA